MDSPKRCVQVESAAHSRPAVTRTRRHSHFVPGGDSWHQLDLERRGQGFSRFEVPDVGRRLGMHHEPDAFDLGRDSLSSSSHFPLIAGESQLANPVRLPLGRALLLTNIYSTTSSAIASNPDGILISSARAVCKLMVNSNLVVCCTGISAGFVPCRTLPV
jgi:hypothetical protein